MLQNNKKYAKENGKIVQDNDKIVQNSLNKAFLDDFISEFRLYLYHHKEIITIFALPKTNHCKNETEDNTDTCHLIYNI